MQLPSSLAVTSNYLRIRYLETLRDEVPEALVELRERVWPLWRSYPPGPALWAWLDRWRLPAWVLPCAREALAAWEKQPDRARAVTPPPWVLPRPGFPGDDAPTWSPEDHHLVSALTEGLVGYAHLLRNPATGEADMKAVRRGSRGALEFRGPGLKRCPVDPFRLVVRHCVLGRSFKKLANESRRDQRYIERTVKRFADILELDPRRYFAR